jgi:nucleoside-diphosphate-sugar epimerase
MKNKYVSLIYDLLSIFFISLLYLPFVNLRNILIITSFNILTILIFLLISFYKKSSALRINKKIKIIAIVIFLISVSKFVFFGRAIYFNFVVYQDILLIILLLLPRIFINLKDFKINFIKDYNRSRQGTLVIGGLGYIGSGVVLDLLRNNEKVSVLDCCMFGNDVLNKFYQFPNFTFTKGYASDVILLGKLLRENSKVVHLAGLVGDPACAFSEKDTRYFNIKTTNIIKDLCFEYQIQRLIFASSCSVYGKTDKLCLEETPTNPVSLYAQTKLDSESELMESLIDTKILRFSTIFGAAERLRFDLVVNLFIAQAFYEKQITVFGGDQERPFLHVKDASKSIMNFLNYKITNTQDIYNIGCDDLNGTIYQIAKLIEKNIPGSTISLSQENVDARNYAVSFQKYNHLFPNQKFTTVEEAIKEFINIFEKKEVRFREEVYSNLLTTKSFINVNKNSFKNVNNFLYD